MRSCAPGELSLARRGCWPQLPAVSRRALAMHAHTRWGLAYVRASRGRAVRWWYNKAPPDTASPLHTKHRNWSHHMHASTLSSSHSRPVMHPLTSGPEALRVHPTHGAPIVVGTTSWSPPELKGLISLAAHQPAMYRYLCLCVATVPVAYIYHGRD